jgi:hypothetical protein
MMLSRLTERWPGIRQDRLISAGLITVFLFVAIASGAVIASENIVLMALLCGAVLSVVLLNTPAIAVWIVLVGTLVITGPLVFYLRQLDRLPWIWSVLGIFLLMASFLHGGLLRRGTTRGPVPAFVIVGVVFVVYTVASMAWATVPLSISGAGARRTVQYWGLFFALALIAFPNRTVGLWIVFFIVLGLCQLPYALYQRFVVHPTLEHNYVFDSIAGTLEVAWNGFGGASGVLAFMQIFLIAAMFAAWRERLIGRTALILSVIALLIPMAVGETNVLFIWMPLAMSAIFIDLIRKRPMAFLGGAAGFGTLIVAFGMVYLVTQQALPSGGQGGRTQTLEERIRDVYEYNAGSRGYANATDLNRTSVIPHWIRNNGLNNPVQATFGHGIGASFGNADSPSLLRAKFGYRSIDLITVSALLWDLGLVGTTLYLATIGLALLTAYRLSQTARPGIDRALARALFAGMVLLFSLGFYNNALVTTASQQVIAMMILGLTAWMARRYSAPGGPPTASTPKRPTRADSDRP